MFVNSTNMYRVARFIEKHIPPAIENLIKVLFFDKTAIALPMIFGYFLS